MVRGKTVAFLPGITSPSDLRVLSAENLDALAAGVELQPVVTAAHAVAFFAAFGQRRQPVAAAVFQRDHRAV